MLGFQHPMDRCDSEAHCSRRRFRSLQGPDDFVDGLRPLASEAPGRGGAQHRLSHGGRRQRHSEAVRRFVGEAEVLEVVVHEEARPEIARDHLLKSR